MAETARKALNVSDLRDGIHVGLRGDGVIPLCTGIYTLSIRAHLALLDRQPLLGLRGAVLVETVLAEAHVELGAGEPQ